jgi:predicted small metal-binding protein
VQRCGYGQQVQGEGQERRGADEDIALYAEQTHKMKVQTPEMMAKIKKAIKK